MDRCKLQENLAALYLRLNGYFVSGLVVHASHEGERTNRTQVDALAVRFPNNCEPERVVGPSEYLQVSGRCIDILICEVKGGQESLQFNRALWSDPQAVTSILHWVGAFSEDEVETLVPLVMEMLGPRAVDNSVSFREVICANGLHQIRAVLFAPDRPHPRANQVRFIPGEEIIDHLWCCLHEDKPRPECAMRYDFGLWGPYEEIIRYFKDALAKPTMEQVYAALAM